MPELFLTHPLYILSIPLIFTAVYLPLLLFLGSFRAHQILTKESIMVLLLATVPLTLVQKLMLLRKMHYRCNEDNHHSETAKQGLSVWGNTQVMFKEDPSSMTKKPQVSTR